MKYLLFIIILLLTGCVCLNPEHKKQAPPIAKTEELISSLEKTKTELDKAGDSNTVIGEKVEKALTLTEKLAKLLEQIEEQSSKEVKESVQ